jgi:hypothetical protein
MKCNGSLKIGQPTYTCSSVNLTSLPPVDPDRPHGPKDIQDRAALLVIMDDALQLKALQYALQLINEVRAIAHNLEKTLHGWAFLYV